MGALLGYLSQRVLGQYDLLVPDDVNGDAVYYVGGNILSLEKRFAFRPRDFRLWIAIHEVTHRAQFTGVPWMRSYFLSAGAPSVRSRRSRSAHDRAGARQRGRRDSRRSQSSRRRRLGRVVRLRGAARRTRPGASVDVVARRARQRRHGRSGSSHVAGQERMSRAAATAAEEWWPDVAHCTRCWASSRRCASTRSARSSFAARSPKPGRTRSTACWDTPENLPKQSELGEPRHWLERVGHARV